MSLDNFFQKKIQQSYSGNYFTIEEVQNNVNISSQKICLEQNDIVAIKLDKEANCWFQNPEKMCDYVFFLEKSDRIKVILIELKSSNIKEKEVIEKFNNGYKLCNFFLELYGKVTVEKIDWNKVLFQKMPLRQRTITGNPITTTNNIKYKPYKNSPYNISKLI